MTLQEHTWLNYAYGIRPNYPGVKPTVSTDQALGEVTDYFSRHFGCKPEEIRYAQNVTTHIASLVHALNLRGRSPQVLVDSHQVKYVKISLETGKLPTEHMTRPNYAPVKQMEFTPRKVSSFDPVEFVKNPAKHTPSTGTPVIVLSHISRLTGEQYSIKSVYQKMKRVNRNAILVVDGAQAVGAKKFKTKGACDMYIGTNSKFIDAEPNLAPAYVARSVSELLGVSDFSADVMTNEIHSTHAAIQHPAVAKFDFAAIKNLRKYTLKQLKNVRGVAVFRVRNQAAHILTLKVSSADEARRIVDALERRKVHIFHNLDWSDYQPKNALLRVSLGVKTTKKEIDTFIHELKTIA